MAETPLNDQSNSRPSPARADPVTRTAMQAAFGYTVFLIAHVLSAVVVVFSATMLVAVIAGLFLVMM